MSSVEHHIQFVRLGYGDLFDLPGRSLHFTTDELDTKSAQEIVKVIEELESFRGDIVAWAIGEIAELWKSKHQQIAFRFGREYSPVLYIHFPFWLRHDKMLGKKETELRVLRSKEIMRETAPDELSVEMPINCLRAWWD